MTDLADLVFGVLLDTFPLFQRTHLVFSFISIPVSFDQISRLFTRSLVLIPWPYFLISINSFLAYTFPLLVNLPLLTIEMVPCLNLYNWNFHTLFGNSHLMNQLLSLSLVHHRPSTFDL